MPESDSLTKQRKATEDFTHEAIKSEIDNLHNDTSSNNTAQQ